MRYLEDRGLQPKTEREGLGVPRRRRNRRTGIARRDHAARAREARQPDLRHQLQPAAPRRSGARQRPDHPGTRSGLPRRRLERHQGDLGPRVGSDLLAKDRDGLLVKRMGEIVDGQYQKYAIESGAYVREHFWGADPRLLDMVKHLSDDQLKKMTLRRSRPDQGLQRLQGGDRAQGCADGHSRADDQGLRPGRSGRRQEHHAPTEKDERRRAAGLPHPLRHPDLRRRHQQGAVLSARRRQRRDQVHARAPRRRSGARRRAARCAASRWPACPPRSSRSSTPAPKDARRRPRWSSSACCRRCCATRKSASWSCRSSPTKRARSAWRRCSGRSASTRTPARFTSRSTWTRSCTTRRRPTVRFSKKASTKRARCRRSSPPAPPTRRTASTPSPSSSTIRCSASSASAT